MAQLRAGVARCDITPPVGIAHTNWGAQTHERAAGVDLDLRATALALSAGDETVVVVDTDLGYLRSADAAAARDAIADLTGLARSRVRVSYVHTHAGPSTRRDDWADEGAEMIGPYLDSLPHRLAGVAWEAIRDREPARIAAGTGTCDIAVNRRFARPEDGRVIVGRNHDGPVDRDVGVVRIEAADGDPIAAVVNYACHPITVGPDNDLLTPDYPGVVKRTVEAVTGATCLFLQGAAGDVGPIHGVARNGSEEYGPLGRRLGSEASRVWWALDPRGREERYVDTLESGAPLAVYEYDETADPVGSIGVVVRDLSLPLKEFPDPGEAEAAAEAESERLHDLRAAGADDDEIREGTFVAKRARQDANLAREFAGRSEATVELQAFALGADVAVVGMPGEPFVEIGRGVKEGSPFDHTLFSGYSNDDRSGYVPTADAYDEGGYEVRVTPFAPEAAGRIVDGALAVLSELADAVR